MKKIFGTLLTGMAITAGALTAFYLILKFRKRKIKDDVEPGLYLLNPFKRIVCEMNKSISETEKRLAKHDELQKMYEKMEWHSSNN